MCRDGQKYAGPYIFDESTQQVSGCPARAPSVRAVIDAINTKASAKGAAATRQHAEALTIEDLKKLMHWSENECPHEMVQPEQVPRKGTGLTAAPADLKNITTHGMMRAFSTSGFTLWTRCVI